MSYPVVLASGRCILACAIHSYQDRPSVAHVSHNYIHIIIFYKSSTIAWVVIVTDVWVVGTQLTLSRSEEHGMIGGGPPFGTIFLSLG